MKKIFIKTMALTVLVFIIGFSLGIWFDSLRLEEVKSRLTEIDNLWNDARLLNDYIKKFSNISNYCILLLEENLKSGDRIYAEGLRIEEYETENRFASSLILEKERYALLDLQFWINSMELKELCRADYSTLIYFYSYYNKTLEQRFQDKTLFDLKQKCGPKVIYITFPADMGISTIDVIKDIYNIKKLPAILINESLILYSPMSMSDLEKYIEC